MFPRRFSIASLRVRSAEPGTGIRRLVAWATIVLGGGMACGEEPSLSRVREDYRVVAGDEPAVGWAPPAVDVSPRPDPGSWGLARARHCDRFRQTHSSQVDILWVVDSSPSMVEKQERLAAGAGAFLNQLLDTTPGVDFRIGVVSDERSWGEGSLDETGTGYGTLLPFPRGHRWLGCSADRLASPRCNVGTRGDAVQAFRQVVRVGGSGTADSKGLLAASLALDGRNPEFLRAGARLQVFFLADGDDTSCGPHVEASPCLASDSCRCDDTLNWGSADHYRRSFRGLKGYGNESAVGVGALVAVDDTVLAYEEHSGRLYVGCTGDGRLPPEDRRPCGSGGGQGALCAFHAPRYLQLAASTGGITADICSDDYGPLLEEFGQAAAGLQRDFRLSRVPIRGTIDIVVVRDEAIVCNDAAHCPSPDESCVRQRCARRWTEGPDGWVHEETEMNAIRFGGASIPEPLHTIEVCYDVDVGG